MNMLRKIPLKNQIYSFHKFNFSRNSYLREIQEREDNLYNMVMNKDDVTTTDLINFVRIIIKRNPNDEQAIQKFFKYLPNHVDKLDELDIRKVCTLLEGRDVGQDLIKQLREKSKHLREVRGVDEEYHQMCKPDREQTWKNSPLAFKFYSLLGVYRDKLMNSFNIIKLK